MSIEILYLGIMFNVIISYFPTPLKLFTRVEMNLQEISKLSHLYHETVYPVIITFTPVLFQEGHPSPGSPFEGGVFEAYMPLSAKGRGFLPRLERAFRLGLTFTISMGNTTGDRLAKVVWHKIPHKTKMEGGKSG